MQPSDTIPAVPASPPKNKGGRPSGANTPEDILRKELRETVGLTSRIRSMVERMLDVIETRMNVVTISPEEVIGWTTPLPALLAMLTKNVEVCGKLLVTKETSREDQERPASEEDIMRELIRGGKVK